jgi:hypothetical protein
MAVNNTTINCLGHVADFPCGWNTFVEPQTYHLGIALESNGYSYSQLVDGCECDQIQSNDVLLDSGITVPCFCRY